MCKYCENKINLDIDTGTDLHGYIDNSFWPRIELYATVDGGWFGSIDVEGTLDINYCPMCGRKLKEPENDEE